MPRASPLAPTCAPSLARYAISCHLTYIHTPMVLQQTSQHSQHQSTARIRVPSGPFGLAEQGLLLLLPLPIFSGRVGTLGIYSILITNQQQIVGKDTTKSCFIPSVPSGLEQVRTRPERHRQRVLRTCRHISHCFTGRQSTQLAK